VAHAPDALQDDALDVPAPRAWTPELLAETALATIRELTQEVRRLVERTTDLSASLPLPDAARALRTWVDDLIASPEAQTRIATLEGLLASERGERDAIVHRAEARATAAEQLAGAAEERCAAVLHEAEMTRRAAAEGREAYARLENETATLRGWLADAQDRVAVLEAELRASMESAGLERQVAEKAQAARDAEWREQRATLEQTVRESEERRRLVEGELTRCRSELERCRLELDARAEALTHTAERDVVETDRAATVELDRLRAALADARAEHQATRSELTLATSRIATLTRVHEDVVAERGTLVADLAKATARETELRQALDARPATADLAVEVAHDEPAFPPLAIEDGAARALNATSDDTDDEDEPDDAAPVEVVATEDLAAIAADDDGDAPVEHIGADAADESAEPEPVDTASALDAADETADDEEATEFDAEPEAPAFDAQPAAASPWFTAAANDETLGDETPRDENEPPAAEESIAWAGTGTLDTSEPAASTADTTWEPPTLVSPAAWSGTTAATEVPSGLDVHGATSDLRDETPLDVTSHAAPDESDTVTDEAPVDTAAPAAAARPIAVLDGASQWDVDAPHAVLPLDAEAAVARVRELEPACCLVNVASPAALATARALRAAGLHTPLWGCVAGPDADAGVALGPLDVVARPITADGLHAQLGESLPAGSKVVAVGSDSATLIPLRQGLLASGASVRVAWNCAQANDLLKTRPNVLVVDLAQPAADTASFVATLVAAGPTHLVLVLPNDGTALPEFCRAIAATLDGGAGEARAALLARAGA
jgi:hypothetical protein